MYRIRKKFKFEAAHRLTSAYSKECTDSIHGHSYIVEIFIESKILNEDGMVIDFKKLKEKIKPLIDLWDHKVILHTKDTEKLKNCCVVPFNPTAENMAKTIYVACFRAGITVSKVRIHETDSGYAEYFEKENLCK